MRRRDVDRSVIARLRATVIELVPDRLVVEANEDYFLDDRPMLEKVEFIFFNDQTAQIEALRSGQVDLVMLSASFAKRWRQPDAHSEKITEEHLA